MLVKVVLLGLLVVTLPPFTFHKNDGLDPPLVGTAVKTAAEPAQTVVATGFIVTLGVRTGLAVTEVVAVFVHPFTAVPVTV